MAQFYRCTNTTCNKQSGFTAAKENIETCNVCNKAVKKIEKKVK